MIWRGGPTGFNLGGYCSKNIPWASKDVTMEDSHRIRLINLCRKI